MNARIVVALLTAVLLCGSASVYAAATGTNTGLVDINIKDVPVKQAIDTIFDGRGLRYIIEPGVTGRVVELTLRGVTVAEALKSLGDAAGFTFTIEDGIYMIGPKTAVAADPPAAQADPPATLVSTSASAPAAMPMARPMSVSPAVAPPPLRQTPPNGLYTAPPNVNNVLPYGSYGNSVVGQLPPSADGVYGGYGGYGGPGFYGGYGYPYYSSAPPWILGVWPNPPPPPDWVSVDQERLLRFQWAVTRRPSFIMPPYWY